MKRFITLMATGETAPAKPVLFRNPVMKWGGVERLVTNFLRSYGRDDLRKMLE